MTEEIRLLREVFHHAHKVLINNGVNPKRFAAHYEKMQLAIYAVEDHDHDRVLQAKTQKTHTSGQCI